MRHTRRHGRLLLEDVGVIQLPARAVHSFVIGKVEVNQVPFVQSQSWRVSDRGTPRTLSQSYRRQFTGSPRPGLPCCRGVLACLHFARHGRKAVDVLVEQVDGHFLIRTRGH